MKKLCFLLIFLLGIFVVDVNASAKAKDMKDLDENRLTEIVSPLQNLLNKSYEAIFSAVQSSLHNGVAYTIVFVTVLYWLVMRLKTGYPSRDEMYEAVKWLFMIFFVFGVFYSFEAYKGFCSLLMLPHNWAKNAVSSMIEGANVADAIFNGMNKVNDFSIKLWNFAQVKIEEGKWKLFSVDWVNSTAAFFAIFWYWFFWLAYMIAMIGGIIIVICSEFIAYLILSVAPIFIPFLTINKIKPYFFSWLKLFISYSLYGPIALILISLLVNLIDDFNKKAEAEGELQTMFDQTFFYFTPKIACCVLVCFLFTKIPNWVSQIMGVSGLDGGGAGAGHAVMQKLGGIGAGAALGGIGGAIGARATGGSMLGGMFKGMGSGVANQLPGAKTAGAVRDSVVKRAKDKKDLEKKPDEVNSEHGKATP